MLNSLLLGQVVYWVIEVPNIVLVGAHNIAIFLIWTLAAIVYACWAVHLYNKAI